MFPHQGHTVYEQQLNTYYSQIVAKALEIIAYLTPVQSAGVNLTDFYTPTPVSKSGQLLIKGKFITYEISSKRHKDEQTEQYYPVVVQYLHSEKGAIALNDLIAFYSDDEDVDPLQELVNELEIKMCMYLELLKVFNAKTRLFALVETLPHH